MFDFRLQVFHTVAKRLSFTKAAEELFITQPAVTKHIREIEHQYKVQLFERSGNNISLTNAGELLLQYTEKIFEIYRNIEFDLNELKQQHKGKLRIGASTTVAQYILPPLLANFHNKFKDIKVSLFTENTQQIEKALEQKEIDFGIIEGKSKNKNFKYTQFTKDELVLIASANHPLTKRNFIKTEELLKVPLLLREQGSGTLEVVNDALKKAGIKISQLQVEMRMNSSESIKGYLLNSNCLSFLSIHSVLKELENNELAVIDVKGLNIERYFYIIHPHGEPDGLSDLFIKFALHYNFK
ncbi:transcriptional regulator [Arachidicoccus ginsenosidimutans]|uniref:LysR family transcriptional regulator n=1 Tax=Arachidicoccus sp. BS20 TaxID=1850526 RepID=UPI0007F14E2F|nr:LysR family transcriptional regulator [Arachidicoccus sp. BS20]ANI89569.1 transcriptional regulator [Arachidicoccus sp. BS20]